MATKKESRVLDVSNLISLRTWADKMGINHSYPAQLKKRRLLEIVEIDGKQFIDISKYPKVPTKSNKKIVAPDPELKMLEILYDEMGQPIRKEEDGQA